MCLIFLWQFLSFSTLHLCTMHLWKCDVQIKFDLVWNQPRNMSRAGPENGSVIHTAKGREDFSRKVCFLFPFWLWAKHFRLFYLVRLVNEHRLSPIWWVKRWFPLLHPFSSSFILSTPPSSPLLHPFFPSMLPTPPSFLPLPLPLSGWYGLSPPPPGHDHHRAHRGPASWLPTKQQHHDHNQRQETDELWR